MSYDATEGILSISDEIGGIAITDGEQYARIDGNTGALIGITYPHHEAHGGSAYYRLYSVASLGAMTTPNDMITLDWTTPNTTKWSHMDFRVKGVAGWRVRLIEAPTGGAEDPTGQLTVFNRDRNSSNTSTVTDGSTAGQINYDSTLATGGTTLWDEYMEGNTTNLPSTTNAKTGERDEIILKQNTKYQLSLFGTDNFPATLYLSWYEHTNKENITLT